MPCQALTARSKAANAHAVWLFGVGAGLDDTLHWKNLVPTDAATAQALILWTLPLASAYAVLGALRGSYSEHSPRGAVGSVMQSAAFAADKLQAAGRTLQYASSSSVSDMRVLYFLATVESVCIGAPFLWGLLPGIVLKLGAPFGVRFRLRCSLFLFLSSHAQLSSVHVRRAGGARRALHTAVCSVAAAAWPGGATACRHSNSGASHPAHCMVPVECAQHARAARHCERCARSCCGHRRADVRVRGVQGWLFKGAAVPRVVQVPFIALGVAALCGLGNIVKSAGSDTVDRDANRDETKYVDSLFQVRPCDAARRTVLFAVASCSLQLPQTRRRSPAAASRG
jgi:hypothetical protein